MIYLHTPWRNEPRVRKGKRKDKKYWVDENGNMWSRSKFYSNEAERLSKSCRNCFGCINCYNCDNCHNCTNCTSCEDCVKCNDCSFCFECYCCEDCFGCYDCDWLSHASGAIAVWDVEYRTGDKI